MLATLVTIIIVAVVLGLVLWLVNSFVPMDGRIKQAMSAIVVVIFVIWCALVLLGHAPALR